MPVIHQDKKHCKTEISILKRQVFMYSLLYFIRFVVPDDLLLGRNMLH